MNEDQLKKYLTIRIDITAEILENHGKYVNGRDIVYLAKNMNRRIHMCLDNIESTNYMAKFNLETIDLVSRYKKMVKVIMEKNNKIIEEMS